MLEFNKTCKAIIKHAANLIAWLIVVLVVTFFVALMSSAMTAKQYEIQMAVQQKRFEQSYNDQRSEFDEQLVHQKSSFAKVLLEKKAEWYLQSFYDTCYFTVLYHGATEEETKKFCLETVVEGFQNEIHLRDPKPGWSWQQVKDAAEMYETY